MTPVASVKLTTSNYTSFRSSPTSINITTSNYTSFRSSPTSINITTSNYTSLRSSPTSINITTSNYTSFRSSPTSIKITTCNYTSFRSSPTNTQPLPSHVRVTSPSKRCRCINEHRRRSFSAILSPRKAILSTSITSCPKPSCRWKQHMGYRAHTNGGEANLRVYISFYNPDSQGTTNYRRSVILNTCPCALLLVTNVQFCCSRRLTCQR